MVCSNHTITLNISVTQAVNFGLLEKVIAGLIFFLIETCGNVLLLILSSWYHDNPYKTLVDRLQIQAITAIISNNILSVPINFCR